MKKILLVITLSIFSVYSSGAGVGKVIDLLINESGIVKIVGKTTFDSSKSSAAKSQIQLSLKALVGNDAIPTKANILKAIADIEDSPENVIIKRSLGQVLSKEVNQVSEADIVKLMNDLITLAGVRSSLFTACGQCALGPLADAGIRVSLKEIKDSSILQLMKNNVIPTSPRKLSKFINNKMKRLGLGSIKDAPQGLVEPYERESLAIFLALAEKGSPASATQRAYIKAVLEFSQSPNGNTILLDSGNPHKLWNIFADPNYSEDTIAQLTEVATEAAKRGRDQNLTNKSNVFYDVIDERAKRFPAGEARTKALENSAALRVNKCLVGK
jgi:hypothetical protein